MNWFQLGLLAFTKLPLEKVFIKHPDPEKQLDKFIALLEQKQQEASKVSPMAGITPVSTEGPSPALTKEETVEYQKREIAKELLLLERHFQQKCKILGKACDCCSKHPLAIEGLAQETLGMTGDTLYSEISTWARQVSPKTTVEASASGQYDEQYPELAVKTRELRKRVMGTTAISPLLSPELSEKVSRELQEILDRALKD